MAKKKTPKQLKKEADRLFSIFIRLKYSDDNGYVNCYTCGQKHYYKEIQNGHFVSRTHLSTRWLEKNCRPQCMACNVWRRGNYDVYALKLVEECGVDILEELNRLKNEICKMGLPAYRELIEKIKEDIRGLNKDHLQ